MRLLLLICGLSACGWLRRTLTSAIVMPCENVRSGCPGNGFTMMTSEGWGQAAGL